MKTTFNKLDYHELLDRAHVANDHFHEYVEQHQAAQANPALKEKAEEVTALMYSFSCLCSAVAHDKDHAMFFETAPTDCTGCQYAGELKHDCNAPALTPCERMEKC